MAEERENGYGHFRIPYTNILRDVSSQMGFDRGLEARKIITEIWKKNRENYDHVYGGVGCSAAHPGDDICPEASELEGRKYSQIIKAAYRYLQLTISFFPMTKNVSNNCVIIGLHNHHEI